MADLHRDRDWNWFIVNVWNIVSLEKLQRQEWDQMEGNWWPILDNSKGRLTKDVCDALCLLSISCPRAEPRARFAMGYRLSKLTGPPSWESVCACVLGRAHQCTCVYVCARPNLKQVSVISPAEAPAQKELIIHTVTLFTVALWSFHLCLSRALGHESSSPPEGSQISSIKWFWGCFLKAKCECQEAVKQRREGNIVIIGKPFFFSLGSTAKLHHTVAI